MSVAHAQQCWIVQKVNPLTLQWEDAAIISPVGHSETLQELYDTARRQLEHFIEMLPDEQFQLVQESRASTFANPGSHRCHQPTLDFLDKSVF